MRRLAALAVAVFAPVALACPVCGQSATEQGQAAYLNMSVILSALPLLAIGGVLGFVAMRVRAAARAEREDLARRVTHLRPAGGSSDVR